MGVVQTPAIPEAPRRPLLGVLELPGSFLVVSSASRCLGVAAGREPPPAHPRVSLVTLPGHDGDTLLLPGRPDPRLHPDLCLAPSAFRPVLALTPGGAELGRDGLVCTGHEVRLVVWASCPFLPVSREVSCATLAVLLCSSPPAAQAGSPALRLRCGDRSRHVCTSEHLDSRRFTVYILEGLFSTRQSYLQNPMSSFHCKY
ncbi:hypothetical protein E2C01_015415 [Portunus trituberculatus]|uniref:Uncharacterized protein n=1 Tax=Portunus trituberculatus TaxID=210409 RepID=A0A5B7DLG3_PORTR|nr:hypothetical protein [Portunus trituberculatus]